MLRATSSGGVDVLSFSTEKMGYPPPCVFLIALCLFGALPPWSGGQGPRGKPVRLCPEAQPRPTASQPCRPERLPVIEWPVREGYRRLFPDRVSILQPLFPRLPDTRPDRLVLYAGGKIETLESRTGRAVWAEPVSCRPQPELLGTVGEQDIFATTRRIFAVTERTGRVAWSFGEEPRDDADADPETTPMWVRHVLAETRLFCLNNRGRLVGLDPRDGSLLWRREGVGTAGSLLAADCRRLFVATWQNGATRLTAHDADTGQPGESVRLDEGNPVLSLLRPQPGALLAVTSDKIIGLDLLTLAPRFRLGFPDRITLSTLQADGSGITVGDRAHRIAKYDLADGHLLWRTPVLDPPDQGPLWMKSWEDRILLASAGTLQALRANDGMPLWRRSVPRLLEAQPPAVTRDAVLVIIPEWRHQAAASRPMKDSPAAERDDAASYRITGYGRSGEALPIIPGETSLVPEPLASFGGLYTRDHGLAMIDGDRLIGYVAQPVTTQRGATAR
jgi:outer membrane protein assembly factor BamB